MEEELDEQQKALIKDLDGAIDKIKDVRSRLALLEWERKRIDEMDPNVTDGA